MPFNLADVPVSLYVHVPWCVRRCAYCDFNAHALQGDLPEAEFLAALEKDLILDAPLLQGRALTSIFIGGGTPSLLSAETFASLLASIRRHCRLAEDIEVTMEANPGTLEHQSLSAYAAAGINRLSLGVQSFSQARLTQLGRIHSPGEAANAIEEALSAGFASVNVDLMYALPKQTAAAAFADLEQALAYGCAHISWYQLTIEPNTIFYSHRPVLPVEREIEKIEQGGWSLLATAGLQRYEVSAYAKSGHACRHNLNYWQYGDYIGIGPGAASKLTDDQQQVRRRRKLRQPEHYLRAAKSALFLAEETQLTAADISFEYLLNALRIVQGVEEADYQACTAQPLSGLHKWRSRNLERGLLMPGTKLRTTALGARFLDDLLADFNV